jgi:hypothetical protein
MDIVPVSDPTIFSEAQRFAQTQAVMQMAVQDTPNQAIPWNQVNVRRRMLKQLRIENIDELLPPVKQPVTASVAEENVVFLQGTPLKAGQQQDHMAHINGHLAYISSPLQLQNPLVPPQAISAMLAHVQEHILMYEATVTAQVMMQMGQPMQGAEDAAMAQAITQAQAMLTQQLTPVMQAIGQVQQAVQQRTPPPPMPPEVQASIQIAQMDTQRKSQLDQATLQLKGQELAATQQLEQTKTAMAQAQVQFEQRQEAQRQQFDQFIEQLRIKQESDAEQLRSQVELMKNEHDNHQKQMTELLMNRDDNETKILIEQMSKQLEAFSQSQTQQSSTEPKIDLTPQLKELNSVLDQMNNQRTNDALTEVMQGLRATIEQLGRPKMLIKDALGKTIGVQ